MKAFLRSIVIGAALVLLAALPAFAQDETASDTGAVAMSVPPSHKLTGLTMIWQDINRCSAAALTIQLSYFGAGDYHETIQGLNPNSEDVSVRLDEMITFADQYGLRGIERTGGTLELIKILVANGFPVLVENTYYDGGDLDRDWMSHNRVITGYDDALGVLYTFDPLLGAGEDGAGRPLEYSDFETRWRPFNRNYLVLYEQDDEPLLQALLGDQWDVAANAEWTLQQLADETANGQSDSFTLFNRGSALVALGRYEEAAAAYDDAFALGLPWRMMWYQFGPYEAYLAVGRNDDVINLARGVIEGTPGVEETYYYIAQAYAAQGDLQRAIANLEVAAQRNTGYTRAVEALAELRAQAGGGAA